MSSKLGIISNKVILLISETNHLELPIEATTHGKSFTIEIETKSSSNFTFILILSL